MNQQQLLKELAEHLDGARDLVRQLVDECSKSSMVDDLAIAAQTPDLTPQEWVGLARRLHPSLGERQEQVLGEVSTSHPDGIGTGPIWKAIKYEQTNTYLTLNALARQGLVRKDIASKPHKYFLGDRLLKSATEHRESLGGRTSTQQRAHITKR